MCVCVCIHTVFFTRHAQLTIVLVGITKRSNDVDDNRERERERDDDEINTVLLR